MTISSDTRKAGPFNGNGVTTSFPFAFKVFATSDVQVIYTDADDVEATLVLDSDYTVSLNADQDANPGGNILYSLLATGEKLTALGSIPYTQDTDIQNQGGFYPEIIETALDKATMLIQQVKEKVDRAVVVPPSSATTSEDYLATLNTYKNEAAASASSASTSASTATTKASEASTSADEAEADKVTIEGYLASLIGSAASSLIGFIQAGANTIARTVQDKLRETVSAEDIGVVSGLVSQAVAKTNADKINAKVAEMSANGGGKLIFNDSLYLVHLDSSDYSSNTSTLRTAALLLYYDNVVIEGKGWFTTKIRAFNNDASYGVVQYTKPPVENGVTKVYGVGLKNICIDGNYLWDGTSYVYQLAAIAGAGIEGLEMDYVRAINSSHYGIGLQNGGYKACSLNNIITDNTGADGIDIKDNLSTSRAFRLNNIYVFNFGQLNEPSNPWAGLDIMSLAPQVSNIHVTDFGDVGTPSAGVRIKQGIIGDVVERGTGGVWANVDNITVVQNRFGDDPSAVIALHIKSPFVNYSNIVGVGVGDRIGVGVHTEERYNNGVNVQVSSAVNAFKATNKSGGTDREYGDGEANNLVNIVCHDVSTAMVLNRKYMKMVNVTLVDCAVGFASGGADAGRIQVKGLHLENVTDPFSQLGGTNHLISDVTGAGSDAYQAGVGVVMAAGVFARTALIGTNGISLYAGASSTSFGTEALRSTTAEVLSQLAHTFANVVRPSSTGTNSIGQTTRRWAEAHILKYFIGTGGATISSGTGSPETVVTAPVGSIYTRTDGGASTTLYIKESGAGNTGWVAK